MSETPLDGREPRDTAADTPTQVPSYPAGVPVGPDPSTPESPAGQVLASPVDWYIRPSGAYSAPRSGSATTMFPPSSGEGFTASDSDYRLPSWGQVNGPGFPASAPPRRRTGVLVAGTVALALVAGVGGGYLGGSLADHRTASNGTGVAAPALTQNAQQASQVTTSGSVQAVATKLLPSVVSVLATSQTRSGEGSGVILTADGKILTNFHVVEGASKLAVRLNDGTVAAAEVVGTDPTDDLAVIKATGLSGLIPATLGSSATLQVGQPVVAIGSPLGLSASVTSGIVSALNRPVRTGSNATASNQDTVMNAVQTDAAINPGNSGGPLVDMDGKVIGINTAIASGGSQEGEARNIGVGFAIPIDQAARIANEIIASGKATRAVLGANVGNTTANPQMAAAAGLGALIVSVVPGGSAEKAGLVKGDVITKIGEQGVESADALIASVRAQPPGSKVSITYQRDGASKTVEVTLGSTDDN